MSTPQSISLAQHPIALAWLRQFDAREVYVARLLLQTLKLVSFSEFEKTITESLLSIANSTEGRIAVFAVDKDPADLSRLPSSAERIGHCLTNLERLVPGRIRVNPSINSMRSERVKEVVIVDDFVGSGGRVRRFWNQWAPKSLKSWLSYRVCRLWLVCYAAHDYGVKAVTDRITYLTEERLKAHVRLRADANYWTVHVESLCEKLGDRTSKSRAAKGVGHIMCPIVFQHGCPNNCPSILWADGKTWRALFRNRAIHPDFYPCFEHADDSGRNPELLWNSGQYRLALQLINELKLQKKSHTYLNLLAMLGLLLKGVKCANLTRFLLLPTETVQTLINQAMTLGLLDANGKVTAFGQDIVKRSKGVFAVEKKVIESDERAEQFYIPTQFGGVRRKSSTSRIPGRKF